MSLDTAGTRARHRAAGDEQFSEQIMLTDLKLYRVWVRIPKDRNKRPVITFDGEIVRNYEIRMDMIGQMWLEMRGYPHTYADGYRVNAMFEEIRRRIQRVEGVRL